jgi:hypothetical protein
MDEESAQNRSSKTQPKPRRSSDGRRHRPARPLAASRQVAPTTARATASGTILRGIGVEERLLSQQQGLSTADREGDGRAPEPLRTETDLRQRPQKQPSSTTDDGRYRATQQQLPPSSGGGRAQTDVGAAEAKELYALRAEVAKLRLRCEALELELTQLRQQAPRSSPPFSTEPSSPSASGSPPDNKRPAAVRGRPIATSLHNKESQQSMQPNDMSLTTGPAGTTSLHTSKSQQTTQPEPQTASSPEELNTAWSASDIVFDWADEMEKVDLRTHQKEQGPQRAPRRSTISSPSTQHTDHVSVDSSVQGRNLQTSSAASARIQSKASTKTSMTGERASQRGWQEHRAAATEYRTRHPSMRAERPAAPESGQQSRASRSTRKPTRQYLETEPTPMPTGKPPASAWLFATRARVPVERLRAALARLASIPSSELDSMVTVSFSVSRWNDDRLTDKEMVRNLIQLWQRLPSRSTRPGDPATASGRKSPPPFVNPLSNKDQDGDRPLDRSQVWSLAEPVLLEACRHRTLLILHDCQGLNDKSMQAARFNVAYFVEAAAVAREQFETETSTPPALALVLEGYPVHRRPVLGGHQVYALNL